MCSPLQQKFKLQYGTRTMAEVAAYTFPDAEQWPFVWVDGYWKIVQNVLPTSLNTGMNLAPLVDPAKVNVSEFEDFVYEKFERVFPDNPDMGGRSHFGRGIWSAYGIVTFFDGVRPCLLTFVSIVCSLSLFSYGPLD